MIPSAMSATLFTQLLSTTPTAVNAMADTPASAIGTVGPKFNPCKKMLDAIVTGWVRGLKATPIAGQYIGTVGPTGVVAPVVITFVNSAGAAADFQTRMAWTGASSIKLINLYTNLLATTTTAVGKLIVPPIPGAGSGTFTVTPLQNAGLASSAGLFSAMLTTAFQEQLVFGTALNPQIGKLITSLSSAFAIMVASSTGVAPVVGPTGPSPFTIPFTGTFL